MHDALTGWQVATEKVHKLFFAGQAKYGKPEYSHGVRQTMFQLFNDTPGMCTKFLKALMHRISKSEYLMQCRTYHNGLLTQRPIRGVAELPIRPISILTSIALKLQLCHEAQRLS